MTTTIRGLGKIALRVENLDVMQQFYQEVIGLKLMRRFPTSAFFKIAEGYAGHTQILALFDRSQEEGYTGIDASRSSIDHLAFSIALGDYENELRRLQDLGLTVTTTTHSWVKWRSLYVRDPEGNQVEFVCYDSAIDGSV